LPPPPAAAALKRSLWSAITSLNQKHSYEIE